MINLFQKYLQARKFINKIPDKPYRFGYKMNWLIIRSDDTRKIANLFVKEEETFVTNWDNGLRATNENFGFISPPVNGWTFVVWKIINHKTNEYFKASDNRNHFVMQGISELFEEVQYFYNFHISGSASWIKAVKGKIERHFFIVDWQILMDIGEKTEIENKIINDLKVKMMQTEDFEGDRNNWATWFEDEQELVMEVAESWSVNPEKIDKLYSSSQLGLIFSLSNTLQNGVLKIKI